MSPDRKKRPLRLGEWFPVEIQASLDFHAK